MNVEGELAVVKEAKWGVATSQTLLWIQFGLACVEMAIPLIACAVYEYITVRNEKRRIKEEEEAKLA